MPAWTDYTSKTTPADTDEVMIKDFSDSNKANKRMLLSGLWNWIVNKLTNAVIANLETSPQTIVGAINSLNSKIIKPLTGVSMIQVVDSDEILLSLEESIYQLAISSSNYIPVTYGTLHIVKGDLFGFMEAIGNNGQRVIRMFDNMQKKWYTGWLDNTTGNLSALTTTAKNSLVSAVNEVNNLVSPVKVGSTATTNKFTVDTTSLKTGLYLITANLPSTAEVGSVFVFTKTNVGNDGMSKIFKIFSTHDETIIEGGNIEFFSGSWYSDVYLKKII